MKEINIFIVHVDTYLVRQVMDVCLFGQIQDIHGGQFRTAATEGSTMNYVTGVDRVHANDDSLLDSARHH